MAPGSPAAASDLKVNDVVLAVDGYRVGRIDNNPYSLASEIRHTGFRTTLTILRAFDGNTIETVRVQLENPPVPTTQRVHALLIGLTADPRSGAAARSNLNAVKDLVQDIPESRRGAVREVVGAECTGDGITKAVADLNIETTDALLVYIAAHGSYNPGAVPTSDSSGGHLIQFAEDGAKGGLFRHVLVSALKNKNAKLTVLVSDTCNCLSSGALAAAAPAAPGEPLIVSLMLRNRGFLDANGAARGQLSWYNVVKNESLGNAGIFTQSFCTAFHVSQSTWTGVFNESERNAGAMLESLRRCFRNIGRRLVTSFSKYWSSSPTRPLRSLRWISRAIELA